MDTLRDLDRLARSFGRHVIAGNKTPMTAATYGEAVAQSSAFFGRPGVFSAEAIGPGLA